MFVRTFPQRSCSALSILLSGVFGARLQISARESALFDGVAVLNRSHSVCLRCCSQRICGTTMAYQLEMGKSLSTKMLRDLVWSSGRLRSRWGCLAMLFGIIWSRIPQTRSSAHRVGGVPEGYGVESQSQRAGEPALRFTVRLHVTLDSKRRPYPYPA